MAFENPDDDALRDCLERADTVAIVGLSDKTHRPSHGVARALKRFGYRIVPVNPRVSEVLGEPAFPDLAAVREAGVEIDIVDVFRSPGHVPAIVAACIELELPALWLQEGVIAPEAATAARDAGIFTVMDRCLYKEHVRLIGSG